MSLPFTFNRAAKTIYGLHAVAGFSATAALDREHVRHHRDPGSIGQQVNVWLELEAIATTMPTPATGNNHDVCAATTTTGARSPNSFTG